MHGTILPPASPALPRYSHILALDLGKFKSVLCSYDPATAAHSFMSLTTDRQSIHDRLTDAAGSADRSSILVVFETCEISGWVYDLVNDMGFKVAVANPANEAWRWTKVKRKTDRDDALWAMLRDNKPWRDPVPRAAAVAM